MYLVSSGAATLASGCGTRPPGGVAAPPTNRGVKVRRFACETNGAKSLCHKGSGVFGHQVQKTYNALTMHDDIFMKTANLTVRIDPDLKSKAQVAARELDVSLSQVVTAALRGVLRQAELHRSWVGAFSIPSLSRPFQEIGESEASVAGLAVIQRRIVELEKLERVNSLNAVTRLELKRLRLLQVTR